MKYMFIAMLLSCSGCSSLPTKEAIVAFSEASSNGSAAVGAMVSSHEAIAFNTDKEIQARHYMLGRHFVAVAPPPEAERIDSAHFEVRLAALRDLQAYSAALGEAADQGAIDQLEAAAQKMATSAAALVAIVNPSIGAAATPALKLAGLGLGYALSESYIRQVLAVIREMDPIVGQLVEALRDDMDNVAAVLDVQAGDYAEEREEQLRIFRKTGARSFELYHEYHRARADIEANNALSRAGLAADSVLKSIYEAHHALAIGEPDVQLAVKRMSSAATDLGALVAAIRNEAGQ